MEITYTKCGDYYLPDLAVPEEEAATYGLFGRMRLKYLKEYHRGNLHLAADLWATDAPPP